MISYPIIKDGGKQTMNFSKALELLKQGKKVARMLWNGKDMFIYLTEGSIVAYEDLTGAAKKFLNIENTQRTAACLNPHIDMKTADGAICIGWLASQTDILAEDWYKVE